MQYLGYELRRILIPRTPVNNGQEEEGPGLSGAPVLSALAVHSPTRLAVPRSSEPDVTNSGLVRTNVNIEPSGAMNMS